MKKPWTFLIGLALLTSCGKEIPSDIIQPEEMEKVLYDYHLTIGIAGSNHNYDNLSREAFKQYVFKKHSITEAHFDSSMVWYTRNAQELATIYANLEMRFDREHAHIEALMESRQEEKRSFLSGDSVDVWTKGNLYWLSRSPLNNQLAFESFTDTTFHPKDAFQWSMDFHFLSEGSATMGFNVIYQNDSVVGKTQLVTESGRHELYLETDTASPIKTLNGFVYLMNDSAQRPNLLLHDISLIRYHAKSDSLAVTDSIPEK